MNYYLTLSIYVKFVKEMAYLYFNMNASTSYAILFTFEFYMTSKNKGK